MTDVSRLIEFADRVTACVNASASLPEGLAAVTDLNPQARLDSLSGPFLAVTPGARDSSPSGRNVFLSEQDVTVFLCAPCQEEELPRWLGVADSVFSAILENAVPDATLKTATLSPLDEMSWLEDGLFVGVVVASWETFDQRGRP